MEFCKKCQADTERNARGRCLPCERAVAAAYRANNPERVTAYKAAYRAANPERVRASQDTWRVANPEKERSRKAAYYEANRSKALADSAAYYSANVDRYSEIHSAYRAANPEQARIDGQNRRARKRASGCRLSRDLARKLFELQQGMCPCCRQNLGDDAHLDHILPLALGGQNIDSNMQLLRRRCNLQKNAKHPIEFMQSRGFLL